MKPQASQRSRPCRSRGSSTFKVGTRVWQITLQHSGFPLVQQWHSTTWYWKAFVIPRLPETCILIGCKYGPPTRQSEPTGTARPPRHPTWALAGLCAGQNMRAVARRSRTISGDDVRLRPNPREEQQLRLAWISQTQCSIGFET